MLERGVILVEKTTGCLEFRMDSLQLDMAELKNMMQEMMAGKDAAMGESSS